MMSYNFKCYDDPNEWFNPETGECEGFEGYLGDLDHCEKCPASLVSCLKCSVGATEDCLECQSGFVLVEGKCVDCSDPLFSHPNCPLSFTLFNLVADPSYPNSSVGKFDLNLRQIILYAEIDPSDASKLENYTVNVPGQDTI